MLRIRDFSATRILKEQNIDQNHQKIIPKFSNRRPFFVNNIIQWNMAIFYSYMILPSSKKSCINFERNKNYNKKLWKYSILGSSRIRIRNFENRIRCKVFWIRNTAYYFNIRGGGELNLELHRRRKRNRPFRFKNIYNILLPVYSTQDLSVPTRVACFVSNTLP